MVRLHFRQCVKMFSLFLLEDRCKFSLGSVHILSVSVSVSVWLNRLKPTRVRYALGLRTFAQLVSSMEVLHTC